MQSIFVSSTFRDMQAERDMLHLDVLPALKEQAMVYCENLDFIDLRWGVNTGDLDSQEGARKVLDVCLDEIERAKPFMLIFLGERYGWIPDLELLIGAATKKSYSIEPEPRSVTALEIEYGILSRPEYLKYCIFCIRKPIIFPDNQSKNYSDYLPESSEHKRRLDELKEKINNLKDANIIYYSADWDLEKQCVKGLEPLAQQLTDILSNLLKPEWKENSKSSKEKSLEREFQFLMEEKRKQFQGRMELISKYSSVIIEKSPDIMLIAGETGCGKSSIMSELEKKLTDTGYLVVPFFCGRGKGTETISDLLGYWAGYIEQKFGLIPFDELWRYYKERPPESVQEVYFNLAKCVEENELPPRSGRPTPVEWRDDALKYYLHSLSVCENRPIVFMADGLDELTDDILLHDLKFLPECKNLPITFLISMGETFELKSIPAWAKVETVHVSPVEAAEQGEMIQGILETHHKGLNNSVINTLVKKNLSGNPFYLSMLVNRLLMMDLEDFRTADLMGIGGDGIDRHMIEIISKAPDNLEQMILELMKAASKKVDETFCINALMLLAYSKNGLRINELEKIFIRNDDNWNSLLFSRLFLYMRPYFIERADGRIDFSHKLIRKSFCREFADQARQYHFNLASHYISNPDMTDFSIIENGLYHARKAEDSFFTMCFFDRLMQSDTEQKVTDLSDYERIKIVRKLIQKAPDDEERPKNETYFSWHRKLRKIETDLIPQFFGNRNDLGDIEEKRSSIMYDFCIEDEGIWLGQLLSGQKGVKLNHYRLAGMTRLVCESLWNRIRFSMTQEELNTISCILGPLESLLQKQYIETGMQADSYMVCLYCRNIVQWQMQQCNDAYSTVQKALQLFSENYDEKKDKVLLSQLLEREERTADLCNHDNPHIQGCVKRYYLWNNHEASNQIERREKASSEYRLANYLLLSGTKDYTLYLQLCENALIIMKAPIPQESDDSAFTLSTGEKFVVPKGHSFNKDLGRISMQLIENDGLIDKETLDLNLIMRIYCIYSNIYLEMGQLHEAITSMCYAIHFCKKAAQMSGGSDFYWNLGEYYVYLGGIYLKLQEEAEGELENDSEAFLAGFEILRAEKERLRTDYSKDYLQKMENYLKEFHYF